jgi:hypothetical protein
MDQDNKLNSGNSNSGNFNSGNWNSGNWNSGDSNSGNSNSGDRNSGYSNSGNSNSGNWNSGNWNSGNSNSGNSNSGYSNSGDRNSGNRNSGYSNSGNSNSGNWNSGNWNSGYFNSSNSKIKIFDVQTDLDFGDVEFPNCLYFNLTEWVDSDSMSDEEKEENGAWEIMGGYLKTYDYKEAFTASMKKAKKEEIEQIKALPNFDAQKFYEISGFMIKNTKTIIIDGKEIEISE